MLIGIVDYGMGNLGSMLNMFKRIGKEAATVSSPDDILAVQKLVLPGVGSFDAAMERINAIQGLRDALTEQALTRKIPVLGVCLGMQLLTRSSEEGSLPGLAWVPATTVRFPRQAGLKVPHMGWNNAVPQMPNQLTDIADVDLRFYFVHSYYVRTDCPSHSLMRTHYGVSFDSAICRDNIWGVQFHPEKSHRFGMRLLKHFAEL
ncbi:MAG: imidazole glycerol phosphate synthase subunit HisH [Planctomycetales bacterium]|nr:imidazole glycerol phosphate synthase subunit HisH [Planctomycetales bacterium]